MILKLPSLENGGRDELGKKYSALESCNPEYREAEWLK